MAQTYVQFSEVFPSHEPYPLIPSFSPSGGEGARRAVEGDSDRFMAPIHVLLWEVFATHEPQKVARASCLFGADRLEACPTLQPAPRFMAPTHVQFLEVFPFHEPQPSSSCSSSSSSSTGRLGFEDEDDDEDDPVHGPNARW